MNEQIGQILNDISTMAVCTKPSKFNKMNVLERFDWANRVFETIVQKISDVEEDSPESMKLKTEARHYKRQMFEMLNLVLEDAIPIRMKSSRFFRFKYSDDIRMEGLEIQIWQAIEALACGQVILHSESTSDSLRPLATKVMQDLTSARCTLAQELSDSQCAKLRLDVHKQRQALNSNSSINKLTCNQKSLSLTVGNSQALSACYYSRTCIEILAQLDESVAQFEWEYMSVAARKLRSAQEAEELQETAVLFSETVLWARRYRLITFSQIIECDSQFMVALPRLAVLVGCRVFGDTLIKKTLSSKPEERPYLFRNYSAELRFLNRHLSALSFPDFLQLARYLALMEEAPTPQPLPSKPKNRFSSSDSDNNDDSDKSSRRIRVLDIDLDLQKLPSGSYKRGDIQSLFKLVAHVSDMLQCEFAAEYRFLMHAVFVLYQDADDDGIVDEVALCDNVADDSYSSCDEIIKPEEAVDALELIGDSNLVESNEEVYLRRLDEVLNRRLNLKSSPSETPNEANSTWFGLSTRILSGRPVVADAESAAGGVRPSHQHRKRVQWKTSPNNECNHCERPFLFLFRRRHHCRRCGYEFCGDCWGPKFHIPHLGLSKPVPVCIECALILQNSQVEEEQRIVNSSSSNPSLHTSQMCDN